MTLTMRDGGTCWLIWIAAGGPPMPGIDRGTCRTCGELSVGLPFERWVRDTFTDQDKLKPGEIICQACQFCFTDDNAELTRITGKEKSQRMRNYSHFVVDGEWLPLSKGEKPRMKELLLMRDPQVAVIAESGQKHIIFRARPGWWQFEEVALLPCPGDLAHQLNVVERLYAGFLKSEIATGRYDQRRILSFGFPEWRALDAQLRRGSVVCNLALFLAQKGDDDADD